jgi:hypothetical protein
MGKVYTKELILEMIKDGTFADLSANEKLQAIEVLSNEKASFIVEEWESSSCWESSSYDC